MTQNNLTLDATVVVAVVVVFKFISAILIFGYCIRVVTLDLFIKPVCLMYRHNLSGEKSKIYFAPL